MTISEFLNESTIKPHLEARNKNAAIEELVDLLVEEHEISLVDRSTVIHAVLEREQMISTGMEHGVAIPHGAVDCVEDVVAALGIAKSGIDFDSMDGRPAYMVILLILPKNKYSAGVRTMAGVTRILSSESLRKQVLAADSSADIMDVIIEEEERQFLEG